MMKSDDLCFALGLSSCRFDLQYEGRESGEQDLFRKFAEGTVSAYLIRISEFRVNSKHHGSR